MKKLLVAIIVLLVCIGCKHPPWAAPPELAELRDTMKLYDETERQALFATGVLVSEALDDLEPPVDPDTGEGPAPEPERAHSRLLIANLLLDALRKVEGDPLRPVSMEPEDLARLSRLVVTHGIEAKAAEKEVFKRIKNWVAEQLEGARAGKPSTFSQTVKYTIALVLAALSIVGYVVVRISRGKEMAMIFAMLSAGVLVIFLIWAYWTYIMIGAIVLILAGGGVIVYLAIKGKTDLLETIAHNQRGRDHLPEEAREIMDSETGAQMPETLKATIKNMKKANDIGEPK